MEALFIVLNDLSYMDEILNKFVELKIKGATIIESQGMASAIMNQDAVFGSVLSGPFSRSLDADQKYSKTIFTVLPDNFDKENIIGEIKKIVEDSKRHVIGFMFTLPVSGIYPLKPKQ